MLSYFNYASLSVLLKKEMGCSYMSSFFFNSTTTTISSEAKEKIRNYLE